MNIIPIQRVLCTHLPRVICDVPCRKVLTDVICDMSYVQCRAPFFVCSEESYLHDTYIPIAKCQSNLGLTDLSKMGRFHEVQTAKLLIDGIDLTKAIQLIIASRILGMFFFLCYSHQVQQLDGILHTSFETDMSELSRHPD